MNHLIQRGLLAFISVLTIYFYYIYYPIHGTPKEYVGMYLITMFFVYFLYKGLQSMVGEKIISIKFLHLFGFFLLQVLISSCFFFAVTTGNIGLGVGLFFKISFLFIVISLLWTLCYSFGDTILSKLEYLHMKENSLKIITSIGLGFSLFVILIFIAAFVGFYSIEAVGLIILGMLICSFKKLIHIFSLTRSPLKQYNISSNIGKTSLFIDEILYIVITFLLSVNILNVFRPFPIGWDDLGVYMNFPKLLAGAGELIPLGQMYFWQLYTGIGFLAGSQTFAFFLNSFAGIVLSVVLYFAIKILIPQKTQNFDFGLLGVLVILMMPMSIFQLAKDMKLDIGLLTISIIALTLSYKTLFLVGKDKAENKGKYFLGTLGLIGFFIGIAFSIKVTSLLLFLGVIAVIFYRSFSLLGFVSFFFLFIGFFTFANLWGMMNVLIPDISSNSRIIFSAFSIVGGALILGHQTLTEKTGFESLKSLYLQVVTVFIGFFIALSPWVIKHISEVPEGSQVSLRYLIGGNSNRYVPDFTAIHSTETIQQIKNEITSAVGKTGVTANEDLGRYFGYESGINNYLKLPWNLTFQTNQAGEFTDITFIFFALIPLIFIILPYRKEVYKLPIIISYGLLILYLIPSPLSLFISSYFANITLPLGYIFILGFFFLPLLYLYNTLDRSNTYVKLFLVNYVFSVIYVFLWSISAFGIVWYGILMYFVFILMIFIPLISIEKQDSKNYYIYSYIVLAVIGVYVFMSAIPHGIKNVRSAGYHEYKLGYESEEGSIMNGHPDYFPILWELNISEDAKSKLYIEYRNRLLVFIDAYPDLSNLRGLVLESDNMTLIHSILVELDKNNIPQISLEIKDMLQELRELVIYPNEKYKSTSNIYRLGTFMLYFISGNNSRILNDNLIQTFDSYIYHENNDEIINRFKKLEIDYILIDLNAATIDNDSRKALTQRYENLLSFVADSRLKLIESDNVCLKLGIDVLKESGNIQEYLHIAGGNYTSIDMTRQQKRAICAEKIVEKIQTGEVSASKYPYLRAYVQLLSQSGVELNNTQEMLNTIASRIPISYKALFKIVE